MMSFSQRNLAEGRNTSSMKRAVLYISAAVIVGLVCFGAWYLWAISTPVSDDTQAQEFTVESGMGVSTIAQGLEEAGLVRSAFAFELYVRMNDFGSGLQATTYAFSPAHDIVDIARQMYLGENFLVDEHQLTFIEGWTVEEMQEYLDEESVEMAAQDLSKSREMTSLINSIEPRLLEGAEDVDFFEGYFYPDTYAVFKDDTEVELAQRMVENFANKMTEEHWEAVAESEYSFYELLTLASIIEKEVRTSEERKLAASVFYNRLEIGQGLESDATINYVIGEGRSRATATDLELDSPYNSYKVQGLPPTPISNPSIDAIEAVLFPAESDYFYFLTIPEEQGGTAIFSETFDEHIANKNRYY